MIGSIPHQKFCFYHLPTRGGAGIKLGDADTSPTYLYFLIVPCCYIINLGCLIIILQSFYIIFGTNLLTQCQVLVAVFCMFFTPQEINTKRSPNTAKLFVEFLWTRRHPMGRRSAWGGAPRGAQPTRARQEAQARPSGLCPPRVPPGPPLCSINTLIFQKPQGSRRKSIPAVAGSRNTRSNLDTITKGFIILIGASPMMREQFIVDLRVRSQQLDGFRSLSFDSQYNGLLEIYLM